MSSETASVRPCADTDFDAMYAIINAAATAYAGVIPADRYHVPYMSAEELRGEITAGVRFWGWCGRLRRCASSRLPTPTPCRSGIT
jgi:hypothetical protein